MATEIGDSQALYEKALRGRSVFGTRLDPSSHHQQHPIKDLSESHHQ